MSHTSTYVFIVGSPRSGTTILSEVLGRHPDVANFYEPYYIWDHWTGSGEDDARTAAMATPMTRTFVRREFELFAKKSHKSVVVEKSPENCFRVDYVRSVFPEAKWIHIIRDGRDSVESIYRETLKREHMVKQRDTKEYIATVRETMRLTPFWRNRLQTILFELRGTASLDPRRYFNKAKWQGGVGWGPRFPGWREAQRQLSQIGFAAMQWRTSIEALVRGLNDVPHEQRMECRYEDFVARPEEELKGLCDFIGIQPIQGLARDITPRSVGKWQRFLTSEQLAELGPVIGQLMLQLHQSADLSWYPHSST